MEEENDLLLALEAKHRKEKKELQAQIQALKKEAKNDKSKKKELTNEIAKLETIMESRHKNEIEAFSTEAKTKSTEEENSPQDPSQVTETGKAKISKAQKRRDKKTQQEKERAVLIKQQEKDNINGPRNQETLAITGKLKERNLQIFPIPSDGDCLYKAVSHQLAVTRDQTLSVAELRKKTADYIKKHKDDFMPFMSSADTGDMMSESEFEEYCDKIISTKVWGGQLELRALSNVLKIHIKVIQATGPESIDQGAEFEGPPIIITYHRHMYSLGEHYNSTQQATQNSDEE